MKTVFSTEPQIKQLVWKNHIVPDYTISSDGILYNKGKPCSQFQINGRNYSRVTIGNNYNTSRIDYMVAYTFMGQPLDAIRLVHVDGNIANDDVTNLMWYRKVDLAEKYKDFAIVESDGTIVEEWRPCVTEYNMSLNYEVSNTGLIRDKNKRPVKLHISHGYRVFYYLDAVDKRTRIKSVHRAVAETFIPNPKRCKLVNHVDGDKLNDYVYNLEWATLSNNSEHAYIQRLNTSSTYSIEQIHAVCKGLETSSLSQVDIANMTGVDRRTISDIYRGRRWAEISKLYNFVPKKWTPELKSQISDMIIAGKKGAEIYSELNIPYDQSAISMYERLRRELKAQGKVA